MTTAVDDARLRYSQELARHTLFQYNVARVEAEQRLSPTQAPRERSQPRRQESREEAERVEQGVPMSV